MIVQVVITSVVLYFVFLVAWTYARPALRRKLNLSNKGSLVVVITGCDSGFGAMTAEDLQRDGFRVVAACLTDKGVDSIRNKVTLAVRCDVTSDADIESLRKSVEALLLDNAWTLWAIINNAGIGLSGYLDWTSMSVFRRVMEVNYFAVVAVSKAFLPLLKKSRGSRIINIGSMAGHTGAPSLSAYAGT